MNEEGVKKDFFVIFLLMVWKWLLFLKFCITGVQTFCSLCQISKVGLYLNALREREFIYCLSVFAGVRKANELCSCICRCYYVSNTSGSPQTGSFSQNRKNIMDGEMDSRLLALSLAFHFFKWSFIKDRSGKEYTLWLHIDSIN